MFEEYTKTGWVLVPIRAGEKAPKSKRWQHREHCVANPLAAARLQSAGLAHAYSGTCALDIDNMAVARAGFAAHNLDLDELLTAPDAVRIDTGREGHAKLLYKLSEPLQSKPLVLTDDKRHAAQMRCATADGLTVQDVLPPSAHPNGGSYAWGYPDPDNGDWQKLPEIPEALLAWWQSTITEHDAQRPETAAPSAKMSELHELIEGFNPDCNYTDWIKLGMALHHESGGSAEGLELWDAWSRDGSKYVGLQDLQAHWRSFGQSANPVTAGSLRSEQVASVDDFPVVADVPDDPWQAQAEARKAKFTPHHATDWANHPAPTWLVRDILPRQDLAMIRGAPSTGKSFLALDIAMSIAGGRDWRDAHETGKGAVAWIAAEAAGSMRNRLRAYAQGHGVALDAHDFWIIGEAPNLSDGQEVTALAEAAQSVAPTLIVVDTLSAASGGANENSGEEMNAVLTACRELHTATGALVLLIHHTGKDVSKGARGWSGIVAAMHTEIEVDVRKDSAIRVARISKQRDAEDGVELPFRLLPIPVSMEDTSCVIEHFETAEIVSSAMPAALDMIAVEEPHLANALMQYDSTAEGISELEIAEFGDLL